MGGMMEMAGWLWMVFLAAWLVVGLSYGVGVLTAWIVRKWRNRRGTTLTVAHGNLWEVGDTLTLGGREWEVVGLGEYTLTVRRVAERPGWGRVWRAQLARLLLRVTGRLVAWVEALQPRGKECDGG